MAAIQCPGCKAHITVPGLIDCPLCQTHLDPPWLREQNRASSRAIMQSGKHYFSPRDWFNLAILGAIILLIGFIVYRVAVPSDQQIYARKVSAALVECQHRIVGLAEYGDAETPPYVKNYGKGNEFYFAWPPGIFHFKNGFGVPVKMSASCIGDVSTGEIKQLTVNGKQVI